MKNLIELSIRDKKCLCISLVLFSISFVITVKPLGHVFVDECAQRSKPDESHSTTFDKSLYKKHTDNYFEPNNCFDLLQKHRDGQIAQTKKSTEDYRIDQSFVVRTATQHPFHVSIHDKLIDWPRYSVFTSGEYYEKIMSEVVAEIFNEEIEKNVTPVMLDIGANIGWFSLLAASHGAEVFAFEPNVINMVRFCESQILNGWVSSSRIESQNRIHSFLVGIGRDHGQLLTMYVTDMKNPGASTFNEDLVNTKRTKGAIVEVAGGKITIVTLDALAKDQGWLDENRNIKISLMKMDVEGLEHLALEGAQKLLQSNIIHNILIELNSNSPRSNLETVISILLSCGYSLYKFGGGQGPKNNVNKTYHNPGSLIDDIMTGGNKNAWFKINTTVT